VQVIQLHAHSMAPGIDNQVSGGEHAVALMALLYLPVVITALPLALEAGARAGLPPAVRMRRVSAAEARADRAEASASVREAESVAEAAGAEADRGAEDLTRGAELTELSEQERAWRKSPPNRRLAAPGRVRSSPPECRAATTRYGKSISLWGYRRRLDSQRQSASVGLSHSRLGSFARLSGRDQISLPRSDFVPKSLPPNSEGLRLN
jgi:hypothetical protein